MKNFWIGLLTIIFLSTHAHADQLPKEIVGYPTLDKGLGVKWIQSRN